MLLSIMLIVNMIRGGGKRTKKEPKKNFVRRKKYYTFATLLKKIIT